MIEAKNISPRQLANKWRTLPSKFEVNVWNFEVRAGKAAVDIFKKSFDLQRFNSPGQFKWRGRRDAKSHPILDETGSLKSSIKWKHLDSKPSGVRIYTDPKSFGNTKRHRGFCFADVHNAPDGTYTYGNTGVRSVQRQYIGDSSLLGDKLKELSLVIFEGFHK
jgi:hypothetical protein